LPIRFFLNGEQFDQEMLRVLGVTFEQVCTALRIGDCDDDVKQAIANKIIELAKAGERNPDLLCERALTDIRQPGHERGGRFEREAPLLFIRVARKRSNLVGCSSGISPGFAPRRKSCRRSRRRAGAGR